LLSLYLQLLDNEEDKSRFERFYLLHRGLMYHAVMKLLRNEMDAEDAVHQAGEKTVRFFPLHRHFAAVGEWQLLFGSERLLFCPDRIAALTRRFAQKRAFNYGHITAAIKQDAANKAGGFLAAAV